jgi:hypothetical protein
MNRRAVSAEKARIFAVTAGVPMKNTQFPAFIRPGILYQLSGVFIVNFVYKPNLDVVEY